MQITGREYAKKKTRLKKGKRARKHCVNHVCVFSIYGNKFAVGEEIKISPSRPSPLSLFLFRCLLPFLPTYEIRD